MRFLALLLFALSLTACGQPPSEIQILNTSLRMPAPGQTTGAVYMTISNPGAADTLLEVKTDSAVKVEMHTTLNENGVMKMRRLDKIPIGAKESVELKSGGMHLMLFGMTVTPSMNTVPLTLVFENAGVVEVSVSLP